MTSNYTRNYFSPMAKFRPVWSHSGLPDDFFSNQKSQFEQILEGLRRENVEIFYGHLEYFTAIWNILRPFGIFYGHLEYFTAIWCLLCSFGTFFPVLVS
jgi:hypothetical protein